MQRIDELAAGRVSDSVLVLHFRSALARLEAQLRQYRGLLGSRSRYVALLGVLALALLLLNELFIRPTFLELMAGMGADLPAQLGGGAVFGTWLLASAVVALLAGAFWLDRASSRLQGFFRLADALRRVGPFRGFREAWQAYLIAVFTRLLLVAGMERTDAIETVRQAVNAELDVDADARNVVVQQAVLRDLELGARLETLNPEVEFWELRALQSTVDRVIAIRQLTLNAAYTLLAGLALLLIWRVYGVVFQLGAIIS